MADTQRDQYKFPMSLRTAMQRAGVLLENFSDVRRREFCEDDQHVMRAALDELDEAWSDSALASRPAEVDDWISVEDRLPEEGQLVIINIRTKYINAPAMDSVSSAIYRSGNWCANGHHLYTPTHWHAMPSAPSHTNNKEK